MSKISPAKMSKRDMDKMLNLLYNKLSKLKTRKEIADFIADILMDSEKIMILRRLQIAKLLLEEKTYNEIRKKLKVGFDNIKTVRHKIDFGSGGYIKFIKELK